MRKLCGLSTCIVLICSVVASAQNQKAPVAPAAGAAAPSDKSLIRLRLQAGQNFLLRTTTASKFTEIWPPIASEAPRHIDIVSTITTSMLFAVTGVADDGAITLKATYRALGMKSQNTVGNQTWPAMTYDSTRPSKSPLKQGFALLQALIGQSITMKVTPDGHIVDVQGIDAIRKRLLTAFSANHMGRDSRNSANKHATDFLTDKYFKESMGQTIFGYPANPVGIGDSWNYKMTMVDQFPMQVLGTRSLRDHKNGVFTIDSRGSVSLNPDKTLWGMNVKHEIYRISGTQTGTTTLDEATGFVQKAQVQQRFGGAIIMAGLKQTNGSPLPPDQKRVPVYCKTTISTEATPFTK